GGERGKATSFQAWVLGGRKGGEVEPGGLSSRSSTPRQLGGSGRRTKTGVPTAPARWANAVSIETTRSSCATTAAVSAKSRSSFPTSMIWECLRKAPTSALRMLFCKLTNWIPGSDRSGVSCSSGIGRLSARLWFEPHHTNPTRSDSDWGMGMFRPPRRSAGGRRYGTFAGIVLILVPSANGKLITGQWNSNGGNGSPLAKTPTGASSSNISALRGGGT